MAKEEEKIKKENTGQNQPDVFLEVPQLKVGELDVEVENLEAEVTVKAQVANLVNLEVGAKAKADKVKLNIKEVEAEATLRVQLERFENILLNAYRLINENPKLLEYLNKPSEGAADKNEESSGLPGVFKKASGKIIG